VVPGDDVWDRLGNRRRVEFTDSGRRKFWVPVSGVDRRRYNSQSDRDVCGVLSVDCCYSTESAALAASSPATADGAGKSNTDTD